MQDSAEGKLSMPIIQVRCFKYEFEGKVKKLLEEFYENTGHYIKTIEITEGKIDAETVKAKVVIEL